MKKEKSKNEEQKELFDEDHFVFNVLHSQLTFVRERIGSCEKTIFKKKGEISILMEEKEKIQKAIDIVKKDFPEEEDELEAEETKEGETEDVEGSGPEGEIEVKVID